MTVVGDQNNISGSIVVNRQIKIRIKKKQIIHSTSNNRYIWYNQYIPRYVQNLNQVLEIKINIRHY